MIFSINTADPEKTDTKEHNAKANGNSENDHIELGTLRHEIMSALLSQCPADIMASSLGTLFLASALRKV